MSRFGGWRPLFAVLAAVLGLALLGVVLPQTASALPGISDCKDAPTPEVPGRGVEAFFEPAPATPPPAADPFAPSATTTIHAQYGYAGARWNTYDLGCTGSPEASVGTTVANWLFTIPKAVVAATGAMLGAAYQPQFLGVFDPLIQTVVDALQRSVFQQWAGLVLAALGFLIVWRARRSPLSGTAAAIGWALLVMVLATVLVRWPLAAGRAADATVVTTMSAVTGALNEHDASGRAATGSQAADNLHDALLYQVWLGGEFGDANSVTARRYGPELFDSQALTWSEAATLNQDPAAGQRIIDAKKAKFKQVAAQVKAEDPDAYEYLVGRRTDARMGFAVLSLFAVACAVPFLLTAALLMIGALVITRFAVMLFPAIATLGLFPTMRNLVIGVGNTVAAAIINALVFGVGSAVMVKAFGVIMAPGSGLPAWLVVALLLLLTLVAWMTLRPFHRLTAMASPGRNHFADAAGALGTVTRGIGRVGGRLVGTAAGVIVGEGAANRKDDRDDEDERGRRSEEDRQTGEDLDTTGTPRGRPGRELEGAGGDRSPSPSGATGSAPRPGRTGPRALGGRRGSGRAGAPPVESQPPDASGPSGEPDEPEALIAAEPGLPRTGGPAAAAVGRRAEPAARGGAGSQQRPAPRRLEARWEGWDVDGSDPSRSSAAPGEGYGGTWSIEELDGEDLYAVYRPDDRDSGGGRG